MGLLAELATGVEAERLDPFVEPNLCIARLAVRAGSESAEQQRGQGR